MRLSDRLFKRRPSFLTSCNPVARSLRTIVHRGRDGKVRRRWRQHQRIDGAKSAPGSLDFRANVNATAAAQQKISRLHAKTVAPKKLVPLAVKAQASGRIRGRECAVGATESALTGTNTPLRRRQRRAEHEAYCAAMAAAGKAEQGRTQAATSAGRPTRSSLVESPRPSAAPPRAHHSDARSAWPRGRTCCGRSASARA